MIRFAIGLVRPYKKWLAIVVGAMLIETAMGLAAPWPLKIVLDSVFAARPMPRAFAWLAGDPGEHAGAAQRRGGVDHRDRAAPGRQRLPQRLLHRQHRSVDRPRPAPQRLRPPAAPVDVVLRQAAGRPAHQHDHRRHQRGAGLRVDLTARHRDRRADDRRHAGGDVHAQLALHHRGAGGDAAAGGVRVPAARRRQAGDARCAAPAERDRVDRAGGPRLHPGGQGVRAGRGSSGNGSTPRASRASRRHSTRGGCGRCSGRW